MGSMSTSPRLASVKHDWGHDESGCTVLHIDMDAFFASCEIARHPELKGKPVIIGTGNRSVVSAASYEARPYGVNSAMPVATARRLCPQGVFLPVDMDYYRSISHQVFAVMEQVTDRLERTSVDEGYMDVSAALLQWKSPTAIGAWIRQEVERRFSVTCSVGVASNKLIAKLASTNAKPDGMLLIPMSRQTEFVQMMPIRAIPGIGPSLGKRLQQWGISTVAQLAQLSEAELTQASGSTAHAHRLFLAAQGLDERTVTPHTPEKSIGAERTFDADTTDPQAVSDLLLWCADTVASTLRNRKLMAKTITVKLRFPDLSYASKSQTLSQPVNTAANIHPQALRLLERMMDMPEHSISAQSLGRGRTRLPQPIRLAGVSVSGLSERHIPVQASFDDLLQDEDAQATQAKERRSQAEQALDSIRARYGMDAVQWGAAGKPHRRGTTA